MIHQYKLNGYNIVLDVFSGAIHIVDDFAYDAIEMCDREGRDRLPELMTRKYKDREDITGEDIDLIIRDIDELTRQGKLFTEDIFEVNAFDLKERHTEIKALCLHVAHTCNLTCSYCFARQRNFCGEEALMSAETGKAAIDFLVARSGERHNLEVDFFGGEPLLNWDVVKEIVRYARSIEKEHNKNFRFTLTTNGMNIDDEVIDFCNREMQNVVLSLDGRKEVHDRFRKTSSGKGSYDMVVPRFKKLVERRGDRDYYMRGTFTAANTDFLKDIIHMADLGFTQLSMEPVVIRPGEPNGLTEEDLPEIFRQYEELALEMLRRRKEGRPFTFYHYMIDLTGGPCIYKRISGCGAGTEYMAVTPWGDLYPCHQFVNDPEYKMGNIYEGILNTEARDEFKLCNSYARPECRDCWARLYCSGGCSANSYHATGSIKGVYEYGCKLFKKRIECAIMMKIAEMEQDTELE